MIKLSRVECDILKKILDVQLNDKDNKNGLTTHGLREKARIAAGNWDSYVGRLNYFQLVSTNYVGTKRPRTGKSKIDFQSKFVPHYYVTHIGFLVLLQNLKLKDINDYVTTQNLQFLPLIAKYLKELKTLGPIFPAVFKYSLDKISLEPYFTDDVKKTERHKSILGRQIKVKIALSFMNEETEISIFKNFHTLSTDERIYVKHLHGQAFGFPNHDELLNDLISNFTFLFYFYLVMLKHDDLFSYAISINAVSNSMNIRSFKFPEEIPQEEYEYSLSQIVLLNNKFSDRLTSIIEQIRNDPKIKKLIESNLDEIDARLLSVDYLDFLHNYVK